MAESPREADPRRDRLTGLAVASAGAALLVAAIGCGAGEADPQPKDEVTAAVGDAAPPVRGRAFTDTSPIDPTLRATEIDVGAAGMPTGLGGLVGSVDPSRLTPEALAENPLVIGTTKPAPFRLADGADPLDPTSYGWGKDDDGHWIISYADLSLAATDKELLLDALVYPDEYEGEEIHFPDRIRALDGEKVALTGYMIPLRWDSNRVPHFMLVRDLLACCFGGAPEPDEWVDVHTVDKGTTYWAFVPVVVRGTFRLAGQSDEAGYATGAFAIDATDAREE
ncbi:MAG: DUF3299 domain-containing protein [Planctomycetota bacterium]